LETYGLTLLIVCPLVFVAGGIVLIFGGGGGFLTPAPLRNQQVWLQFRFAYCNGKVCPQRLY